MRGYADCPERLPGASNNPLRLAHDSRVSLPSVLRELEHAEHSARRMGATEVFIVLIAPRGRVQFRASPTTDLFTQVGLLEQLKADLLEKAG